jgi:hypothetical protein
MKRNALTMITIFTIAILTAGLFNNFTSASEGNGARALEGTWKVRLTPRSGGPQFDEFMTFTSGGGIVESNNFPFFQMGLNAGPGHGNWEHAGAHSYKFAFSKFLFALSGQPAGTLKAAGVITYSPETGTWSGPANVSICDNLGQNCFTIDTTDGAAARMPAE